MVAVHGTSFLNGLDELKASGLLDPVQKVELYLKDGKETNYQAVMKGDNLVSVVKPTYEIYQNSKFIEDIESTLNTLSVRANVKDFKDSGSSCGILLDFPDYEFEDPSGKKASYQLLVRNSYDSTTAISYVSGMFRFVCLNMMTVGVQDVSVRVKHTTTVESRMEAAMKAMQTSLQDGPKKMADNMRALSASISDPEVFNSIVRTSLEETKLPERVLRYAETPLAEYAVTGARREQRNAYGALCVISDSITHGTNANVVAKYDYLRRSKNSFYDQLDKHGLK